MAKRHHINAKLNLKQEGESCPLGFSVRGQVLFAAYDCRLHFNISKALLVKAVPRIFAGDRNPFRLKGT